MIKGYDLVAQAQSGTGKTGTFTIGALQNVDIQHNKPQILILSPTRELSIKQIKLFKKLENTWISLLMMYWWNKSKNLCK